MNALDKAVHQGMMAGSKLGETYQAMLETAQAADQTPSAWYKAVVTLPTNKDGSNMTEKECKALMESEIKGIVKSHLGHLGNASAFTIKRDAYKYMSKPVQAFRRLESFRTYVSDLKKKKGKKDSLFTQVCKLIDRIAKAESGQKILAQVANYLVKEHGVKVA